MRWGRRALGWTLSLVTLGATGCLQVLGDFDVEPLPAGVSKCEQDSDCGAGACYAGTCTLACGTGNPCPAYRACSIGYCSLPVGTPCKSNNCGGGICADRAYGGIPAEKYCTLSCAVDKSSCPPGYACDDSECRRTSNLPNSPRPTRRYGP
ncbi:MAG: hypothetical protein IT374_17105 [Polyangiaceae bacterium]|nr:hypothetical protein [Polyangiaceae bacterium]